MEKDFYRHIAACLAGNRPAVLATVIFRLGSAPREAGAAMAIFDDGLSLGTVGGGPLEAEVLQAAGKSFAHRRSVCLSFSFTDQENVKGGMICGGRVEVLVDFLKEGDAIATRVIEKIAAAGDTGKQAWLVRSIRPDEDGKMYFQTGLGVILEDDADAGSLDLAGFDLTGLKQALLPGEVTLITGQGIRYLIQPVFPPERVIIAGAGHVGRELAALCAIIGLSTVIIDDRPDFANHDRFPAAFKIVIPQVSFADCFAGLSISEDDRIVIVTRGHEHDRAVLFQALRTPAGYIGMIGSRKKREAIYESLRKEGVTAQDLARVHCPIGLSIGARTPAEIAVSIVAQLIALRAERN